MGYISTVNQVSNTAHQVSNTAQLSQLSPQFYGSMDAVQGVIKSYDPVTGDGVLVDEVTLADVNLSANALERSVFRMLRQGQRVNYDIDENGLATRLRLGSEVDMTTPDS